MISMDDDLKVEDTFLMQSEDLSEEVPIESAGMNAEKTLLERWRKWVEAVDG